MAELGLVLKRTNLFIFFSVLCSLNFYSVIYAQEGVLKDISYAYMLGAILISSAYFMEDNKGFVFPVQVISISVLFSIFMAHFSWGQSFVQGLSTVPYLMWFVFFYLLHLKFPVAKLEAIILFYGTLYLILYFFQFFHNDVVYFGFADEFREDRGTIRINFPGTGVFILSYFIALNRTIQYRKYKLLYYIFIIVGYIATVLQVTRQTIAILSIITVFNYTKESSVWKKVGIVLICIFALFYFFNSDSTITRGLLETQKETVSEGSQYIRVVAANYFLSDFSPNTLSKIFGNGFPNNTSTYGKFTSSLEDVRGFSLSDIGFIGFYIMFGIFAVIAYLFIFVKTFTIATTRNYIYLRYYIVFLLFTCLTSDTIYSINFTITNVFVIYCFQLLYEQKLDIGLEENS